MTSYIDHYGYGPRPQDITHSWTMDLCQRLRWLYGDPHARMTSPEWQADIMAWRRLGVKRRGPPDGVA